MLWDKDKALFNVALSMKETVATLKPPSPAAREMLGRFLLSERPLDRRWETRSFTVTDWSIFDMRAVADIAGISRRRMGG